MKKPISTQKWIAGLTVFVFVLMAIASLKKGPHVEHADRYIPTEIDAYIMAKHFVTESLKAPSTAEFASNHQSSIQLLERDKFKVSSFVDAQNSFGAMIRTDFTVVRTVDRDTKRWVVVSLEME